jgi:hypothetical protein
MRHRSAAVSGEESAVILASILTQQPKPPIELNSNIPIGLQDAINACLEKDRELRYQDAGSQRADLKRVKRDLDSGALGVMRTTSTVTPVVRDAQSSVSTTQVQVRPQSGATATTAVVPVRKKRGPVIGLSVAAVALVAALVAITMFRGPSTPPPAPQSAAATPPAVATPQNPPQRSADDADAARRRADAARFDEAIVDGNRFLAAGDADGASRALSIARAIDPGSPAVTDLSARLVAFFKAASARKPAADPPRSTTSTARAAADQAPRPVPTPTAVVVAPPPPPAPAAPAPEATQTARPPAVELPAAPTPTATPPRPEPAERRAAAPPPAPAPPVEDDDAAIRRVVATYARAIETKDLGLYRTVKPNLSAAEQRTIEDGFRAVASQRVTITIQSIERHPQDALVRLRRQDVIQVSGRQQTTDSQQTMRLARTPAGWVIREIGR